MTVAVIRRTDPVRGAFSDCSTGAAGAGYYETVSDALRAFDAALSDYGYYLDPVDWSDWSGDSGRNVIDIYADGYNWISRAIISYHRMESDRWEFVGYIA